MQTEERQIAADVMEQAVATASPRWSLAELERVLWEKKVSGLPVVDGQKLVGVVSRTDLIRQRALERSRAGEISDYFRAYDSDPNENHESQLAEASFVTEQIAARTVADVMSPPSFVAPPDMPVREVAALLVEHRIHRVPIVEQGRLVGIISTFDIVRLVAGG